MGARPDTYISLDVEADGPIPGPYSMLSFGLCIAGGFDGKAFTVPEVDDDFYVEIRPISDRFDTEALAVSGLDRARLVSEGEKPHVAMSRAAAWINAAAGETRPVLVAFPLSYDWMFFYWYLEHFASGQARLNHSSGLDMKTMYQQKARTVMDAAGRDDLPAELRSPRQHTHNALDDAREQAEIFVKLFNWHRS